MGGSEKVVFGIREKLIFAIIPVVLIALVIVTVSSAVMTGRTVNEEATAKMTASLNENINMVDGRLEKVRKTAEDLSILVSKTYKNTDMAAYKDVFTQIINADPLVLGSGIWFEPGVYTGDEKYAGQQYVGPYWYKDSGQIVEDWEYSNAEYDYFVQEYYVNAKALKSLDATMTDPYYDPSSGIVMSSCSAPIFDNGTYIGCITVDISLETISDVISKIKIGDTGKAILLTSKGVYIYSDDPSKIADELYIADDPDSISSIASVVLGTESGQTSYKGKSGVTNAYFSTLPELGWKLVITIEESEIKAPVYNIIRTSVIILILAIIICSAIIVGIAGGIAASVERVKRFAGTLAQGDFTVEKLEIRSSDEIGRMSESLNHMYENNAGVIRSISEGSVQVSESSTQLTHVAGSLTTKFSDIRSSMTRVNDAMTNTGAATQEVSASANEVNASVQHLADETRETMSEVKQILARAAKIESDSRSSCDNAISIADIRGKELESASQKAVIIEEIGTLADAIAGIAEQINLLSLNASIEAARAGEHGRGFAVVASEINKLASETSETVEKIKLTITGIQEAFAELDKSSSELLAFVKDTVTPDYEGFIEIGQQYGKDAQAFGELTSKISEMVENIRESMDQVNDAVASIAESANETAESSAMVTDTVEEVNVMVEDISSMAQSQHDVSSDLNDIVNSFKLTKK